MKKSKRILSFLMAVVMMTSVFSVMADALAPYKDAAVMSYDDTDRPVFTFDQCCSMFLDHVDNFLVQYNRESGGALSADLGALGIYDFTSVDNILNSITDIYYNPLFQVFPPVNGDLNDIDTTAVRTFRRSGTPAATADTTVIFSILQFLNDNKTVFAKFIEGDFNWGLITPSGILADLNNMNVSQTIKQLLCKKANPGTAVPETVTDTADALIQQILNHSLAGSAAAPLAGHVDMNSESTAYDFLEGLLQNACNLIAVPLLNTDLKKAVRAFCGVDYSDPAAFPDGDASGLNEYADVFNIDFTVPPHTFAAGDTVVSSLNGILGEIASAVLKDYTGWTPGDTGNLLNNLAAAGKHILKAAGEGFFPDYITVPSDAEIDAMSSQTLFAYIARSALNAAVSFMNIPAGADTLTKVAWHAVKELLAQYIPANDYSAQPQTLEGILFMLADLAACFINRRVDMNPAAGALPGQGLLPYGLGFNATLTAAMNWVKTTYGGLFSPALTGTDGWADLDTLVFSVVQRNWLPADVTGSKDLLINRILDSVLNLDLGSLLSLFGRRSDSDLASKTVKKVLLETCARAVNIVFPASVPLTYTAFDQMIDNANLKTVFTGIIDRLNAGKASIVPAVLPAAVKLLKINVPEQFAPPDILLPAQISAAATFTIRNNSKGVNTGFTDKNGSFTRDSLYKVKILSVTSSLPAITPADIADTVINGGDCVNCALTGTFAANQVLRVSVTYDVYTETGAKLTSVPLTAMAFSYVSPVADDGRNFTVLDPNTSNKHTMKYKNIYCNQDYNLANLAAQDVFIAERAITIAADNNYAATISRTSAAAHAALIASGISAAPWAGNIATTHEGGIWSIPAFAVDTAAARPADGAYLSTYKYNATKTSIIGGAETFTVNNYVVFYNDCGLPGLLSAELNAGRDPIDYADETAWNDYILALTNAVAVCYRPRTASAFMTQIAQTFGQAKTDLEEAVTALEACEPQTGYPYKPMVDFIHTIEPPNDGLEYDDPNYTYFGIADFVPYTYLRYNAVKKEAQSVIVSQTPPVEPVLPADPAPGDIAAYNEATAQWLLDLADFNARRVKLKSIDAAYLLHKLDLSASRLIPVQADKTLLDAALAEVQASVANRGLSAANCTAGSWAAYQRALAFAGSVSAQSAAATGSNGFYTLRQTKVITARNHLVEAAKELVKLCDYTQLDYYISIAEPLVRTYYTDEQWALIVAALVAAKAIPRQLPYTAANQARIDAAADALRDAIYPPVDPPGPHFHTTCAVDTTNRYVFPRFDTEISADTGYGLIWHPTVNGSGTGTTFDVERLRDGEILSTWTIVVFGDVNGDRVITAADADICTLVENWMIDWDETGDAAFLIAGDTNADSRVDSVDADVIGLYMNWLIDDIYLWPLPSDNPIVRLAISTVG